MILQHIPLLSQKRIILASQSPRRQEILRGLGLSFEVKVSTFEEDLPKDQFPSGAEYAQETARQKALDVARQVMKDGGRADLVIAADTVVEQGSTIMEKPGDAADATMMLNRLSGKRHEVHTGVALVVPGGAGTGSGDELGHITTFAETTHVQFAMLNPEVIQAYVDSGEPFGKAGGYGIQGTAGSFVERLEGCYFNVVGFPLHRFTLQVAQLIHQGVLVL